MDYRSIDINEKFSLFEDCWNPKVIGNVDDYYIKAAKIHGHFTWHAHEDADEVFFVHKGEMRIDFRDGTVGLKEGEMFVVPKGKEH